MYEKEKPKRKHREMSNARACLWVFFMIVVMPAMTFIGCLMAYWFILEALVALNT